MSVRKAIGEKDGIYFITMTNCHWLHLFALSDSFDAVYKWFDYLKANGHYVLGYVIMPNHLHCLIAFRNTNNKTINSIVGNGKRFMAYDIVSRLNKKQEFELLDQLAGFVNQTDRQRGKRHEVFEPSFDCKECYSEHMIAQKLNYIHENPCQGKWNLAENPADYKHSSAKYYLSGVHATYEVTNYRDMMDIDLTKGYENK